MPASKKKTICILLDPAHGWNTPGKKSPDGALKEYLWSRMMCDKLMKRLQDNGYRCLKITDSNEEIGLANRVQIEHNYSNLFGRKNTLFFSIHVNAAGSDGHWKNARGWSVFVAKTASANSKKFAELLFDEIDAQGFKTRKPLPKQKYWEQDFYVVKNTYCPAALAEAFFMDNHEDCALLLSKEGQDKILDAYYNAVVKYVDYVLEQQSK